jgi:hypothetical protein
MQNELDLLLVHLRFGGDAALYHKKLWTYKMN